MALNYRLKCRDFTLLFLTRILRMFSYGMLSVVFFTNLFDKSLSESEVSWLQSAIVFGDIFVSLALTTHADRFGRVNTLMVGALLKFVTGVIYASSNSMIILLISGILGVISVSGGEIGPFMPIEQSSLTQLTEECTPDKEHIAKNTSMIFGYYNMAGYISQAFGAVFAGFYIQVLTKYGYQQSDAVTHVVWFYALFGLLKFIGYFMMERESVEPKHVMKKQMVNCTGIHKHNLPTIIQLSALFALDAFAGGFIVQSYLSFYYQKKYDLFFDKIGGILFVCNIVSGISGVLSSKLVDRIGAMATMIYTHLPSNVFLLLIAFTNTPAISIMLLMARFCISQMDVPARQTYVSMVVSSEERSAANGITNIARSVGLCFGLGLNGLFFDADVNTFRFSMPFAIAGGLKIFYDITIGCLFLWNKKKKESKVQSTSVIESQTVTDENKHHQLQEQVSQENEK